MGGRVGVATSIMGLSGCSILESPDGRGRQQTTSPAAIKVSINVFDVAVFCECSAGV